MSMNLSPAAWLPVGAGTRSSTPTRRRHRVFSIGEGRHRPRQLSCRQSQAGDTVPPRPPRTGIRVVGGQGRRCNGLRLRPKAHETPSDRKSRTRGHRQPRRCLSSMDRIGHPHRAHPQSRLSAQQANESRILPESVSASGSVVIVDRGPQGVSYSMSYPGVSVRSGSTLPQPFSRA